MTRSDLFLKFIRQYHVRAQHLRIVPLRFWEPQRLIWEKIKDRLDRKQKVWLIILKARRMGISTLCESLILSRVIQQDHVHSMVMASNSGNTQEIWRMASTMIDHSPWKPYSYKARKEIVVGNSRLTVATAATPDAVRAWDLTCLHGSELAFWERPETLLSALQCLPDHVDTFCFLESTANGKIGNGGLTRK